jgi:hypothetical protein
MKKYITAYVLIFLAGILSSSTAYAFEYHLRGQLSGWYLEARDDGDRVYSAGVRYIPQLDLLQNITAESFADLEASANAWATIMSGDPGDDADIELYRLKLRYATARTETRLGLQVINFGPAYLLRPLRWFDRLDPRDPLKLTDGVYALLFKIVAQNNTNIWLWGLYGNDDPKGPEIFPSSDDRPELGGRLQAPAGPGEIAFTFHSRMVDNPIPMQDAVDEMRFGLDGRWDVEIGLWFEATHNTQYGEGDLDMSTTMVMGGADYTLGIGNGLHVLGEHMVTSIQGGELVSGLDDVTNISALMLGYPSGYLDYFNAICFYDWDNRDFYVFGSWQRTWDDFALNVSIFHNPERVEDGLESMSARGTGGQVILIFNH